MWGTSWGERAITFWLVVAGCVMAGMFANGSSARSEEPVRHANSIRKGVVSALDLENAPEKIFLEEFQQVLARRAKSGNRVIEFTRFNYNTVFERQSCESGVLAFVELDGWIMATRPVESTPAQINLRKGWHGATYQFEQKPPEFICARSTQVILANPENQEFSVREDRATKKRGFSFFPSALRFIEQPQVALLTWPWPEDDVLIQSYVNGWKWRITEVKEAKIRFHAEWRFDRSKVQWNAMELIVDRNTHRIDAVKLYSTCGGMEQVYVVAGESRNINDFRFPFLAKFEKQLSRLRLPAEEDFLQAGYFENKLPEVIEASVSALEPENRVTTGILPDGVRSLVKASSTGRLISTAILTFLLKAE